MPCGVEYRTDAVQPLDRCQDGAELTLRERSAMALSKLSGDEQLVIFSQLCNPFDPGVAVAFASASKGL